MASSEADGPTQPEAMVSEPEVDVTPEMIRAGVMAYYDNAFEGWESPGGASLREMMVAIFRAMAATSRKGRRPPVKSGP
jgi:hypothetical protein